MTVSVNQATTALPQAQAAEQSAQDFLSVIVEEEGSITPSATDRNNAQQNLYAQQNHSDSPRFACSANTRYFAKVAAGCGTMSAVYAGLLALKGLDETAAKVTTVGSTLFGLMSLASVGGAVVSAYQAGRENQTTNDQPQNQEDQV